MKKTTIDIIKILPFDEKFKIDLAGRLNSLTPDQRFTIEQVVWNLYTTIYKIKLQENLEKGLMRQRENNLPPDPDLLKKTRAQTEEEIEKEYDIKGTQTDISAVRYKLQKLINEKKPN